VRKRLQWEALAEFGYLARRGRALERVGCAALGMRPEQVEQALARLGPELRESLGLHSLAPERVAWLVWGLLFHLKHRGAIVHPFVHGYIEQGGRAYVLGRLPFLPNIGPHSRRPVFLSLGARHGEFDTIERSNRSTWYQDWVRKTLAGDGLLPEKIDHELYAVVCAALVAAGVLSSIDAANGSVLGLSPGALFLEGETTCLATEDGASELVVPASLAPLLAGMPAMDLAVPGAYAQRERPAHWVAHTYRTAEVRRVIAAEHTGLLDRKTILEPLEARFKSEAGEPWNENLLSATPTLEMGVDIGDLSSVLLCSVPPTQANYLQRVGRAGRRDGNALTVTVATGGPHDLYFYARPEEMMAGPVEPPGVFLNASAVLFRQLTAFCLDAWVATGIDESAMPVTLGPVIDAVDRYEQQRFPYNFIDFVKAQATTFLEGFCKLLADSLTERTRAAMEGFVFGGDDSDGLRVRLVKRLQAVAEERKAFANRAKSLKNELDKLKRAPQDEATQASIEAARRERDSIMEVNRSTNAKNLLNFLTDEGLIPNYAFPEEGVTLRSVLWRRRREPVPGGSPYESWVLEYERGAAAAIQELAPNSHFFASGRRVQVDQIDLTLSPVESWRLCASCSHAERLDRGDAHSVCPRCGDVHWADVGQQRHLVRLRHVMANSEDVRSRIDDGSDERDVAFFNRQLLPDFLKSDVQFAYRIASDTLPFGFEFVRKVVFRDINFGKLAASGDTTFVGGREAVRGGFRLCRHCGKVQTGRRRNAEAGADTQDHAFDCPQKDQNDPEAIIDCLYLYREFQSEALRILLPVTRTETDARVVPSLSAAIRLGLRLQFGGKVDHLHMVPYEEPDRTSGTTRRYLLIYDTVPGGTGYLDDLLRDASRLFDVLQLARDHMSACPCNQDTEADGCYRCLFAYRLGSGITSTSRRTAVESLSEILDAWDKLEAVETLSDILINPSFESALEARFIEAFQRRGGVDPSVRIQQDVVRGKPGYYLRVGDNEYTVEPQVALGSGDGVSAQSKPDFLIRPARSALECLPVAVFTDGFEYHKSSATEDTYKRLAIQQSGRFWTWSLTWQDIEDGLANRDGSPHPLPASGSANFAEHAARVAVALGAEHLMQQLYRSPFDLLIEWLRRPEEALWAGAVFARLLAWAQSSADTPEVEATRTWILQQAPGPVREPLETMDGALCGNVRLGEPGSAPALRWVLPGSALKSPLQPREMVALLWLEPTASPDEKSWREAWSKGLAAANLLQFLPRAPAVTAEGCASGIYEGAGWARLRSEAQLVAATGPEDWQAVLVEAVSEAADGLNRLLAGGAPAPVAGYELLDESGAIVADAELAWLDARVAVLRADQAGQRPVWQTTDWTTVVIGDGWDTQVLARLSG
jgi:DEAD/DEAH box helicase domain-containing protein